MKDKLDFCVFCHSSDTVVRWEDHERHEDRIIVEFACNKCEKWSRRSYAKDVK